MTDPKYTQAPSPRVDARETGLEFESARKKFATQMDAELLSELRAFAKSEGRHIQSVLEDAVKSYLEQERGYQMKPAVRLAYQESLERYSSLYEALAK